MRYCTKLLFVAVICAFLAYVLSSVAQAAVIGTASDPNGMYELHDEAGDVCVGQARKAFYVHTTGERIGGCWKIGPGAVYFVFFDGDRAAVPVQAITTPEPS